MYKIYYYIGDTGNSGPSVYGVSIISASTNRQPVILTHPLIRHTDEPRKDETAVCGSTIFVWDDWGGDHWFPVNREVTTPPACLALLQCSKLAWGNTTSD